MAHHEAIVISDLHIGGAQGADGGRGFRMLTQVDALARFIESPPFSASATTKELIINGDIVDFLAEDDSESTDGELRDTRWSSWTHDEDDALRTFNRIATRDARLFEAMRKIRATGVELTLILGNHDLELALPRVRRRLFQLIGGPAQFIFDGEGYLIGDALIEHGNRYDGFNHVDYTELQRYRERLSRGEPPGAEHFRPPVGSELVVEVMNRIKEEYPFVDLLKPEVEGVVPVLLALEPKYRDKLWQMLQLYRKARAAGPSGAQPGRASRAKVMAQTETKAEGMFRLVEDRIFGSQARAPERRGSRSEVSARDRVDKIKSDAKQALGLLELLRGKGEPGDLESRLDALFDALRGVRTDISFRREIEGDPFIQRAAHELLRRPGVNHLILGHTHLPKLVTHESDSRCCPLPGTSYVNTGTWADLIAFPPACFSDDRAIGIAALRLFVRDLEAGSFAKHLVFQPTFCRVQLLGERAVVDLQSWSG